MVGLPLPAAMLAMAACSDMHVQGYVLFAGLLQQSAQISAASTTSTCYLFRLTPVARKTWFTQAVLLLMLLPLCFVIV